MGRSAIQGRSAGTNGCRWDVEALSSPREGDVLLLLLVINTMVRFAKKGGRFALSPGAVNADTVIITEFATQLAAKAKLIRASALVEKGSRLTTGGVGGGQEHHASAKCCLVVRHEPMILLLLFCQSIPALHLLLPSR